MTTIDPSQMLLGKALLKQLGINPGYPDNVTQHHTNKTRHATHSVKGKLSGRDNTPTPTADGIKMKTDIVDLGLPSQLDTFVTDNNDKTPNDINQNSKGAIANRSDIVTWAIVGAVIFGIYILTK